MLGKKLSELSTEELMELNSRLVTGAADDTAQPPAEEQLH
jgi:hypothetical protein